MPFADKSVTVAQQAIISQLLETDSDIREKARALVLQGLTDLVNLQRRGDPAVRAAIAKQLSGPVTKAIFETGDDDGNSELRAEMHEMMEEMRGEIMGHTADDELVDPPVPLARLIVPKS